MVYVWLSDDKMIFWTSNSEKSTSESTGVDSAMTKRRQTLGAPIFDFLPGALATLLSLWWLLPGLASFHHNADPSCTEFDGWLR